MDPPTRTYDIQLVRSRFSTPFATRRSRHDTSIVGTTDVADCCWRERKILISAAVQEFSGHLLVVDPSQESPCYRCLLPEPPVDDAPGQPLGILGAVAGVMGCLQAVEALKLLLGRDSPLTHQLLSYDGLRGRFHLMARSKSPDCPLCEDNPSLRGPADSAGANRTA